MAKISGPKQSLGFEHMGKVIFSINVTVDVAELATWQPEMITAFFDGIAKVLQAEKGIKEPK